MKSFETLWDKAPPRILALPGATETLVIAFASIGHDASRPPSPEFVGTATADDWPALLVMDASRSRANAPDFAPSLKSAVERIRARHPISRVVAIGQSIGGFAALVAASLMPIDMVLAFGPQSSIDPASRPEETRWREWTARVVPLKTARAPLTPGTRTIPLHGLHNDRFQALGFPQTPGVDHILFPDLIHSALGPHLKQRGVLDGLLGSAIADNRRTMRRIAAGAGGILRQKLRPY